ncbi:hypothetical protein FE257_007342 [Aspergillus nanangensis]|uniref:Uncharacterized protein n=1 Tax=Aspergillus nanangensis TaxID=2582783 RepID=A0AAD4CMW1_ASPNN|nr:hypothetical protein FE257_007342 [Aspergillus nanangensis]
MTKDVTFNVHYSDDLSHTYYGDGKELAQHLRDIYKDQHIDFPDDFESTLTYPPVHYLQVNVPDELEVEEIQRVEVPPGLNIMVTDIKL